MFTSICGEITLRGSAPEIVRKYEGMAYGAEREGDVVQCHIFRQHAEHWKRVQNERGERDNLQEDGGGRDLQRPRHRNANLRPKTR